MGRLTSTSTQYAFLPNQTLGNGYAYDANSNRVSFTNPQGGTTTYSYDTLNRQTSLTDFSGRLFSFTYDALGRRTGLTRPNGVNTSCAYDSLSRLLSVLHQAGSAALDGVSYAYDAAGNRTSKTVLPSNLTSAYSYGPAYELTKVMQGTTQKESYTYDAVGNRTYQPGAPYTYNSSNEMLTREGVPYTYDANGNTLSKTNSGGATHYAWDFENRLTSATLPTGSVVSFQYETIPQLDYWHILVTDLPSRFLVMSWLGANYTEKRFHSPIETVSTAFPKFEISIFMRHFDFWQRTPADSSSPLRSPRTIRNRPLPEGRRRRSNPHRWIAWPRCGFCGSAHPDLKPGDIMLTK
jgi:YD repeat-containing protein